MKRMLVFVGALFLACGLAQAGQGGGCKLPDFTGLSADQRMAAALGAGFQLSPTSVSTPACPVTFNCNQLRGCSAGSVCSFGNIGPCCDPGGGTIICCESPGNIWVTDCACECTGPNCSPLCETSVDVQWSCF